jgi:hypothetical protein
VRDNRLLMGELETFAHDLHTYLTTGVPLIAAQITETVPSEIPSQTAPARPSSGAPQTNSLQAKVSL